MYGLAGEDVDLFSAGVHVLLAARLPMAFGSRRRDRHPRGAAAPLRRRTLVEDERRREDGARELLGLAWTERCLAGAGRESCRSRRAEAGRLTVHRFARAGRSTGSSSPHPPGEPPCPPVAPCAPCSPPPRRPPAPHRPHRAVGSLVDVTVAHRSRGEDARRGLAFARQSHLGRRAAGRPLRGAPHQSIAGCNAARSVDGVNAVSGETAAVGQTGYVLGPYQTADITGWRKSYSEAAAFYFTALPDSYAPRAHRPDNVGVTAPWSSASAFPSRRWAAGSEPPLAPRTTPRTAPWNGKNGRSRAAADSGRAGAAPRITQKKALRHPRLGAQSSWPAREEKKLGTGHGEREYSPTSGDRIERALRRSRPRSSRCATTATRTCSRWASSRGRARSRASRRVPVLVRSRAASGSSSRSIREPTSDTRPASGGRDLGPLAAGRVSYRHVRNGSLWLVIAVPGQHARRSPPCRSAYRYSTVSATARSACQTRSGSPASAASRRRGRGRRGRAHRPPRSSPPASRRSCRARPRP